MLRQYTSQGPPPPQRTGDGDAGGAAAAAEDSVNYYSSMTEQQQQAAHIGYVHPISSRDPRVAELYNGSGSVDGTYLDPMSMNVQSLAEALAQEKLRCQTLERENHHLRREISRYIGDASVSSTVSPGERYIYSQSAVYGVRYLSGSSS